MFKVLAGSGEAAYDRLLTETSAYYLLGVEVGEPDLDGRTHEIEIKVRRRGVTVRGRKWVALRKHGASPAPAALTSSPALGATASAPVRPLAAAPRPLPATVQPLAAAFEHADYIAVERQLERATDLANLIRDFRQADRPWPDAPRRRAVFALEIGLAGLHSDNGYARDEGIRLLAEYNIEVRQLAGADGFECAWLWTQAAGLESAARPAIAAAFIGRSLQRCPNEARLYLADAVVAEQQWLRGPQTSATASQAVIRRYEEAMKHPATAAEARVRGAAFLYRLGMFTQALALLSSPAPSPDRYVQYLAALVRGQVLRSIGRLEEAEAGFRTALEIWGGAQSARVALMTLLVSRGDREEAVALAEAAETATDDQIDPWWTYWLGDARVYPDIIARLRELGR
jgi:tetratricopeptide (TPR) repeat protein